MTRPVPVQITINPKLLREIDELADKSGRNRSQLIADGLRGLLRRRRKAS